MGSLPGRCPWGPNCNSGVTDRPIDYWPRYRREIVRCLVEYAGKSQVEAEALVDDRNLAPEHDGDWIVFHELPWYWAMVIVHGHPYYGSPPEAETQEWLDESPKLGHTNWRE